MRFQRGYLVRTVDGYFGVVMRCEPPDTVVVFLGNGVTVDYPQEQLAALPFKGGLPSDQVASFAEILRSEVWPEAVSP